MTKKKKNNNSNQKYKWVWWVNGELASKQQTKNFKVGLNYCWILKF